MAAACLFSFAPAAAAAQDKPDDATKSTVRWEDGATVLELENFRIALSNRVQFRFTLQDPDDSMRLAGTAAAGDPQSSFRIRRAKQQLEGWFWQKELTFELQWGWAGSDAAGGSATFSGLEDALLNWDASRNGSFQIQIGQFKVPFGRQEMTSSERQQFVDRSILSGEFTLSRDIGAQLWGGLFGGKLEYRAGAFNGAGRNRVADENDKLQYNARLMLQPWGDVGYSEGDLESSEKPLVALAAGFQSRNQHNATNTNDFDDTTFSFDGIFKYKGFSAYGEAFLRERVPEQGPRFDSNGFLAQAGCFLVRSVFEIAGRYAMWDPSSAVPGDRQVEKGVAASYFVGKHRHRFKLQADYRQLEDRSRGTRQRELRTQVQFVF
jgi:hypothetical protein